MILTVLTSVLLTFWLLLCGGLFLYHYFIEVVLDLPVTGQSPCSAHTLLKQIIQRLLRDANDLPGLVRQEIDNEVPSDDNRTYEDLLATAIINKIVTTSQTHRPSSSANSVSSRLSTSSRTRDDKEYYFGEETLDTKWKTTDLDTTSVSSIEDWMHNDAGSNKYVDRVTLTIKQNIEEVPLSDSEDEEDQDDAEYFKNKSLLSDDDANWYLQKRQFQGTHSPVPVPMLVPDPTGDAKVLIGDKELDETSDLSDVASDFGDIESAPSVNCILLKSKTVIGGKNFTDSPSMGSDGELSADSGVREEKDFDEFGSNNNIDENIHYAQAVNTASKTDITVDDDNVEDASIVSSYSNTEKDTEYTEKFASLPRTIVKNDSVTKQPEEKPSEVKEPEESETEADDNKYPEIEFEGTYSKKDKEKWKNAVQMENNPYSKENLEKRLNRSSSSVSSLFGTEYYIRQAGRATGGKAKGEGSLPIWPAPPNDDVDDDVYVAKPAVVCDNDDEPQIEPQVLPTRKPEKNILDTSASEVTSDSDLSYNRYDVSNAEIHRQHHIPDDSEVEMFSCEDRAKDPETSKPVVIHEDLKKPLTIPANPSPNKSGRRLENGFKKVESKQPNRPTSLHLGSKTDQETKLTPLATTKNSNGTTPTRYSSVPNLSQSPFDEAPTIIRRKKDNTLISKIYMDPNVRKEALAKRDFIPNINDVPQTPSITSSNTIHSPLFASTPVVNFPKPKPSLVQSLAYKIEENQDFETQEVQTNMLYSSDDSGAFDKISSKHDGLYDEDHLRKRGLLYKEMDPIIETLNSNGHVAATLGKFSKSVPDLKIKNNVAKRTLLLEENNNNNDSNCVLTEEEESRIHLSVKDLKRKFEKIREQNIERLVIHSLTARNVKRKSPNFN
ncbi:uncharacterized protein LOC109599854 isoform X2 [Aethina tumida]|uniref:uncharacterized protein LOC109599854 isoform X2 n=1 Tax=Aethina tumida TaxID=116153 RepID=UPI0021478459|nr:uncharacterized protein LOC109599854 isoform X2 [Aethina tumida]